MKRKDHSPTLTTILRVEAVLKQAKEPLRIAEIKRRLPKQVNHYTIKRILQYLEESKKISFSLKGISWRFDYGS